MIAHVDGWLNMHAVLSSDTQYYWSHRISWTHETWPVWLAPVRWLPSLNAGSPILHIHILRAACLRDNSLNYFTAWYGAVILILLIYLVMLHVHYLLTWCAYVVLFVSRMNSEQVADVLLPSRITNSVDFGLSTLRNPGSNTVLPCWTLDKFVHSTLLQFT